MASMQGVGVLTLVEIFGRSTLVKTMDRFCLSPSVPTVNCMSEDWVDGVRAASVVDFYKKAFTVNKIHTEIFHYTL